MEVVTEGIDRKTAKLMIGHGWAGLLDELYDRLPESIIVSQVKEKFGVLRVYYWAPAPTSGVDMESLVSEIEHKSEQVCEFCGQPGHLREGGWLKTRCDECDEKWQKRSTKC